MQYRSMFVASSSALAIVMVSSPALAQENTSSGLTEIVVTAQKREQSIQDVPTSVTALTSEQLEVNRISSVTDLDSVSPALTITTVPAGNSSPVYSMRGEIGLGTAPGADKGVALYIDGVYIGSASGSNFELADIERIEVLKGPQGTLFGRNSTGGAVSITTQGPRGEFHVKQKLTYGNYDQFQSTTRIDTPQFGPLSAAFTYSHSERRGDMRNLGAGTVWDGSKAGLSSQLTAVDYLGNQDSNSFAASVKLDVSPDFYLEYKFDHSTNHFSEAGVGQLVIPAAVASLNTASGSPLFASTTRPGAVNNWMTVPSQVKGEGHVLSANWQINDQFHFKNILAERTSSYFAPLNDLFGTGGLYVPIPPTYTTKYPFDTVVTLSAGHDKQWSEEAQFDYDSQLMHVTTGGIWYHQNNSKGQAGTGYNSINFQTYPNFVIPIPANAPVPLNTVTVTSWAFYGQAEVHVTPTVTVVGGARYTKDKKRGLDYTTPLGGDLNYDGSKWTYNAGINYKPTNDILIYAKYSTGYISGGKLATLSYNAETAKSWEAGIKADWLDHRLRTNLSVYTVKYGNLQLASSGLYFNVPAASQVLVNAGDARAKGFELEVTAKPVRSITLGANLAYLNFHYTRLDPRFAASGQTIPTQRPKWTANLSAQYDSQPLWNDAYLSLHADANYRSAHAGTAFTNSTMQAIGRIPKAWLLNGVASINNIHVGGANVKVAAWVKNLLDEKGARYVLVSPYSDAATYEQARTFGADLTIQF